MKDIYYVAFPESQSIYRQMYGPLSRKQVDEILEEREKNEVAHVCIVVEVHDD